MGLFNRQGGPQQYNPMMMQLAQQMMQSGMQRPMTYGRTDGYAAGLTSAGNSLVGALMMKPQMAAYQKQVEGEALSGALMQYYITGEAPSDDALKRMGVDPTEFYDFIKKEKPEKKVTQKTPGLGRQIAGALLQPFGVGGLVNPKQAAGAPSGQKAAPAAKGQQPMVGGLTPQMKQVVSAMMMSNDPKMKENALKLVMDNMERPMTPQERYVKVGGDSLYDVATGEVRSFGDAKWSQVSDLGDSVLIQDATGSLMVLPKGAGKVKIVGRSEHMSGRGFARSKDEGVDFKWAWGEDEKGNTWPIVNPATGEQMMYDIEALAGASPEPFPGSASKQERVKLEEKIRENKDSLRIFDDMRDAYTSKAFLTIPGRKGLNVANWVEQWGVPLREWFKGYGKLQSDYSKFYSAAKENINQYIHKLSGAQVSQLEAVRLAAALPDPDIDGETRFWAKFDRVEKATKAAIAVYEEAIAANKTHEQAQAEASAASKAIREGYPIPESDEPSIYEKYNKAPNQGEDGVLY